MGTQTEIEGHRDSASVWEERSGVWPERGDIGLSGDAIGYTGEFVIGGEHGI